MRTLLLLLLVVGYGIHADSPWQPDVRVSVETDWDSLNQGESCFAVWGDSIFVICNTAERSQVPIAPYAYSFDGGETFEQLPFTDASVGIVWHTDPVIGVDDSGHVHMLIQFSINRLNHYLSRDGGLTWYDTTTVTSQYGVDKPWMVVNGNEIYITWEQVDGQIGIWFAKSTDYGRTFTLKRIWDRTGITALDMDETENLHLALLKWYEALYYRKSTDKGETWSEEQFLSYNEYEASYGDRFPINSITTAGRVVFITWVDTRNGGWDIWGIRSTDGGDTWQASSVVDDMSAGGQCKCWTRFDVYGGLHVTYYHTTDWPTSRSSPFSLRYQYSSDSGSTFHASIRVSDTACPSMADFMGEYHVIQSDSQYIYAIWTDGRNPDDNDLYFSKALISELSCEEWVGPRERMDPLLTLPTLWHGLVLIEIAESAHPLDVSVYDGAGRFLRDLFSGTAENPVQLRARSADYPSAVLYVRVVSGNTCQVKKVINLR